MTTADGQSLVLAARVCRPLGDAPSRVVVLAHGSFIDEHKRQWLDLPECKNELAGWFLSRGNLVISALRRGYGATGGTWAEDYGRCVEADYYRAGRETARDIEAVVSYATELPYARSDGAVIVGHSGGGLGALAYDSLPHPRVAAMINLAGGRGGHFRGQPNNNCHSERLVEAVARYAHSASTPMLWIYAENDTYFDPQLARRMHDAFIAAGGRADLYLVGSFGSDGHGMFLSPGGSRIWGPIVERYLASQLTDSTPATLPK